MEYFQQTTNETEEKTSPLPRLKKSEKEIFKDLIATLSSLIEIPVVESLRLPHLNRQLKDLVTQCQAVSELGSNAFDNQLPPIKSINERNIQPNEKLET